MYMQAAQKRNRTEAPTPPSGDNEGAPATPVKFARVQHSDQAPHSAYTAAAPQGDSLPAEVPEVAPATTSAVRALLLHYMHPVRLVLV